MNFKRFLLFLVAPLAMVMSSCEPDAPVYTTPAISITDASGAAVTALNFAAEGGDQTITITATRGWSISKTSTWFAITPSSATNESMEEKTTEVKITAAPNDGEARTETIKVVMDKTEKSIVVSQAGEGQVALGAQIFGDNFDNGTAQDNSGWPALDGFVNPVGDAAEGVTYTVANVQARSNSPSNNSHSGYKDEASGNNNAFFRTNGVLTINNINLSAQTSKAYTLTFGCYRSVYEDADNSFKSSEFHVLLSADGEKWTEVAYTRPADEVSNYGTWNKATATFSLKEKPETLSIRFVSDLASSHRMDDVKFFVGGGGAEVDLANGTTSGGNTGGNEGGTEVDPNAQTISVADFIAKADTATTYQLTGTIVGPVNTTFGNFDLEDESGKIYVYGLIDGSTGTNLDWAAKGLSEGDIITVQGKYYFYKEGSKHEIVDALYISHTTNSTPRITSISPEEMSFSAEGGSKVATVNTAGNGGTLAATTEAGWLTVSVANGEVSVVAEANAGEAREAEVTVTYGESTATVTVKQAAPIVAGSVVTATITFDDTAKRSVYTDDQQVWEENGITVTNDKAASTTKIGDYAKPARFYKSSNVTVSVAGTISKLVFHINSSDSKYLTAMTDSVEGETVDGNAVTIVLDGTSSSYSFTTANQVRVDSIDVTYTAGEQGGDNGETPENPEPENPEPENPEPEDPETPAVTTLTVAEFLKADEDAAVWYQLTGVVKNIKDTTYGNFDLVDETGSIYVYGLTATKVEKNDKSFSTLGLVDGDTVTLMGVRAAYNGTAQVGGPAYYVSHIVNTTPRIVGVSPTTISFVADGGEKTVTVNTLGEGGVLAATTAAEWLTVSAANGVVTVVAAANEGEAREAEVTVTFGEDTATVAVAQGAYVPAGSEITLGESYSYTFEKTTFSANGTVALGNLSWTLAGDGGYWGYDSQNGKGQQFGSSKAAYKSMTLTTEDYIGGVQTIKIKTSGASDIKGTLVVTVGGVQIGNEITLTKTATEYTLEAEAVLSGAIVLTYTQTSSKAIYINSIAIN